MLKIKALPVATEKPKPTAQKKRGIPYLTAGIALGGGIVCFVLWAYLHSIRECETSWEGLYELIPESLFNVFAIYSLLYVALRGLAITLPLVALALAVKDLLKTPPAEDTTMRRTFFVLGIVLLFPAGYYVSYWYEWQPRPHHALIKRTVFTFGSQQQQLPQNSTPISMAEHRILWMTDERIDHMTPMELFFYFRTLENLTFSYNFQVNYQGVKDTFRIGVTTTIIMFILAFASIIASFFMPRQEVVVDGWSGSEWT